MPTAQPAGAPPLPGCAPLFDAAAMRDADRRAAAEHAMPSILLMERAGLASAEAILDRWPGARQALVVVGKGNNGGDGMVVARHLAEAGWAVEVAAPGGEGPATEDGRVMAAIAATLGLAVRPFDTARPPAAPVVVDALLGTGARGAPRGAAEAAVRALSAAQGAVVSLDVPSGVDADTGRVAGPAVCADLTVTYHGDKVGLRVDPGRAHAGEVVVADIGIPRAVRLRPAAWLCGAGAAAAVPAKAVQGDKYRAGAVLVVAGHPGMVGAGCLAARATLRAGAGLTVVAVPASLQSTFAAHLLEVMCAGLPDRDGALTAEAVGEALNQSRRMSAVAVGPGLGRSEETTAFVRGFLAHLRLPAVIDADGLWHLGSDPAVLETRGAGTVFTPHAGEAARMLGCEREEVEADRLGAAKELAARWRVVVVLKGRGTITADWGGLVMVNDTGTPALASAGTGDVLTGVTAAFLAKGLHAHVAAAAAVAVHGRAGELAARGDGTVAGDVVEALPGALWG